MSARVVNVARTVSNCRLQQENLKLSLARRSRWSDFWKRVICRVINSYSWSYLVQMSALLADVGLNILEAHVFSTTDGYSLNVFVVDGWPTEV